MANYAVGRDWYSTEPWEREIQNISPFARILYDENPELAFTTYLKANNFAPTAETELRNLYQSLFQQWQSADLLHGFFGGEHRDTPYRWVDFLSDLDPNRELARYGPAQRQEDARRFSRPVRWVEF